MEDLGVDDGDDKDEASIKKAKDAATNEVKLELDPSMVVVSAALLLLDRGDDPPRCTTGDDDILAGDGEEVALHCELLPLLVASTTFSMYSTISS